MCPSLIYTRFASVQILKMVMDAFSLFYDCIAVVCSKKKKTWYMYIMKLFLKLYRQ